MLKVHPAILVVHACACLSCPLGLKGTSDTKRYVHLYRPSTVLIYRRPDNMALLLSEVHPLQLGADINKLACGTAYRGRKINGSGTSQPPVTWGDCLGMCSGSCIGVSWEVGIQDPFSYFESSGFCTTYDSASTTNDNAGNSVFTQLKSGCGVGTCFGPST